MLFKELLGLTPIGYGSLHLSLPTHELITPPMIYNGRPLFGFREEALDAASVFEHGIPLGLGCDILQ